MQPPAMHGRRQPRIKPAPTPNQARVRGTLKTRIIEVMRLFVVGNYPITFSNRPIFSISTAI
jgi:hypothetical protein